MLVVGLKIEENFTISIWWAKASSILQDGNFPAVSKDKIYQNKTADHHNLKREAEDMLTLLLF